MKVDEYILCCDAGYGVVGLGAGSMLMSTFCVVMQGMEWSGWVQYEG